MTRYLLDSHVFLWYNGGDPLLSGAHREHLEDAENELLLSVASVWKLTLKRALGKLQFSGSFSDATQRFQTNILPIRLEHAEATEHLPRLHGDPFDHMLIAAGSGGGADPGDTRRCDCAV